MNITLQDLTKRFPARGKKAQGETTAVRDLTFEIPDGKLVGLLGPSGCGKSTTLNMICGLERPTSGKIFFGEEDVTALPPELRGVGMVFQNYALYPHLTVMQNILFPLENLKGKDRPSRQEMRQRALETAKLVQIEELLERKPKELSGGQQQRVAIARALVKEPQILLLDEPFSNLDARLRIELREDIRALQKQLGITTIFVTHDQEEAMSISDRILLMRGGRLQQYSTPEEMYRRPYNRFTAGFLGNPPINFLPCRYEGGVLTVPGAPGWHLPADRLQCAREGISGEAVLGIRPEDLLVGGDGGILPARITALQPLGKEVYLKLAAGPHTLTASLSWDHDYQVGDELELSVKKLHLFPPESGKEASAGEAR